MNCHSRVNVVLQLLKYENNKREIKIDFESRKRDKLHIPLPFEQPHFAFKIIHTIDLYANRLAYFVLNH